MKKRLLSALLALALVFVLLPTTALADTTPVTDENVKINGTPVTVGNGISLGEGNGTYSYDKSTRTLTLNNATITATGSNIGIDFCDTTNYVTYSVILTGENTVTSNNIAIETSVYKGYKQDKIEMRGDRAEMSDFPLYLNMVAGGLDCRDQAIGGFSFVVKIYAVPVVEIIG